MDQFFLRDKFTKSNYQFVERNKCEELVLSDVGRKKVDKMHIDCMNRLLTFHETFDFDTKSAPKKYPHSKISDEINVEKFFESVLIKLSVKDERSVDKLASESPYTWFLLQPDEVRYSIKCLDDQLQREGFFNRPVDWLIQRGVILPSKCLNCKIDHEIYRQINDEFYWVCSEKCSTKKLQLNDNLSFASNILTDIPSLIYNWSIYSNSGLLKRSKSTRNITLDSNVSRLVINTFRRICQKTNECYVTKLGVNGRMVELYTCNASDLFIVFAYEIDTTHLKFKILKTDEITTIVAMFKDWFDPSVQLVFYENKFEFLSKYYKNVQLRSFEDKSNNFLSTVFKMIARNVAHGVLTYDIFTTFIHEVIWRSLFGKTPYSAFQFMVSLILKQPLEYEFYILDLVSKADSNLLVDEVYYGSFDQTNKPKIDPDTQLRNNIRCHKCFIPHNFISISNHLMSHFTIESKKPERRLNLIDTTCHHCFTKFRFADLQMHRDLLEGNLKRKNLISACKICCKIFKSKKEYIDHLREIHRYQDQPYSCTLCPFRTSFYHEKLSHYKNNHADIVKAYCKHCLMIFTGEDASKELFTHFKLHIDAKVTFKCNKCALSFVSEQDHKKHYLHDHIVQSKRAANFVVTRYKPETTEDDNVLKIKIPKHIPLNKVSKQKRTRDGRKVLFTKKNFIKLRYEDLQHDNIVNKDFIVINNNLVICLECSQPIDTNHLTKKAMKCNNCDYIGHCVISIKYPCGLHMSGVIKE